MATLSEHISRIEAARDKIADIFKGADLTTPPDAAVDAYCDALRAVYDAARIHGPKTTARVDAAISAKFGGA